MKILSLTVFLLFTLAAASDDVVVENALDETVFPATDIHTLKSFTNFRKLVEDNKLNVSIVVSSSASYSDGHPKESMSVAVTWPLNKLALTNSSLDKAQGQNFLKVATEDKLAAKAVIVEGENSKVWTNKPNGIPVSEAHRLLTTIKNGKTGFVWNDRNYISHYTFLTENKQIIKIFYGDLDIETVSAKNITDKDINRMKRILGSAFFTYPREKIPQVVVARLKSYKPEIRWQVVAKVDANSYINAKTSVMLKVLQTNYLIFHT
jgi:hypothetical protein